MGVGLLCSECGRFIAASEIAWKRISGAVVCAECFYAEQSKQASKAREND